LCQYLVQNKHAHHTNHSPPPQKKTGLGGAPTVREPLLYIDFITYTTCWFHRQRSGNSIAWGVARLFVLYV